MAESNIKVEERRQEVRSLKRMGLSNSLISAKLNVPVRTIERDLAWWREQNTELCRSILAPNLIGDTISTYAEIEGLALNKVKSLQGGSDSGDLAKLLAVALKSRSEMIDFLFRVGTLQPNWQDGLASKEYDVSKMGREELAKASQEIDLHIKEVERQLAALNSPDPFKSQDMDT